MARKPITELDFFAVKKQLKDYLKGQDRFRDYDFDGSNMSVLLDVLSYNTYQNNFYTNMALSEMFLDSATLENSVLSHAKELNYLPRSAKSSMAVVSVTINAPTETANTILIPRNTKFRSRVNRGEVFNFYTTKSYIANRLSNGNYFCDCVEIYEGELADEAFFLQSIDQRISLTNENIDTSSIRVLVNPSEPTIQEEYVYRTGIFGVERDEAVFYLQAGYNGTYEVYFGRDVYGKTPSFNEEVRVFYRITSGSSANGIGSFSTDFRSDVYVSVTQSSYGGGEKETLSDTKFYAPRSVQIQERAVTRRDYETLLKQRFNNILDVSVYDAGDLDPPQYGKVAISVNVDGGISENNKSDIINYLSDKTPLAIQPVFVDADYMYINMLLTIYIDENSRTKSDSEIKRDVLDVVSQYNIDNLEKFASTFRISRLTNLVDNTEDFILSNTVYAEPFIEYNPALSIVENPKFDFGSALIKPYPFVENKGFSDYKPAISSSYFVYNGTSCFMQDDGIGNIQLISSDIANTQIINPSIGIVDYSSGVVKLSDFIVESYSGTAIKIYTNTIDRNITSPNNRVLRIREDDVAVTIIGKR